MSSYKYIIDKEAYEYLQEWTEQYKEPAKYCPMFGKRAEIVLHGVDCKFFVEENRNGDCKCRLLDGEGTVAKGYIVRDKSGEHDFEIQFDLSDRILASGDEVQKKVMFFLRLFCGAFKMVNYFMFYGNLVDNKEFTASGRNDGTKKIITLRKYKDSVYAVPVGSHRGPEGVFSVRGHFRRYQNGKIIWIDEFLKGT